MNYGDVALGVECALPMAMRPARRHGRARRLIARLIAALTPRA
jgi:hypothetical protein